MPYCCVILMIYGIQKPRSIEKNEHLQSGLKPQSWRDNCQNISASLPTRNTEISVLMKPSAAQSLMRLLHMTQIITMTVQPTYMRDV